MIDGGGDIFVGASLPFGVVKSGIDTYDTPVNISASNGGYTPQGKVTGISLLHESGACRPLDEHQATFTHMVQELVGARREASPHKCL